VSVNSLAVSVDSLAVRVNSLAVSVDSLAVSVNPLAVSFNSQAVSFNSLAVSINPHACCFSLASRVLIVFWYTWFRFASSASVCCDSSKAVTTKRKYQGL
jgi:hypothetical protein